VNSYELADHQRYSDDDLPESENPEPLPLDRARSLNDALRYVSDLEDED
jgi:hypothetical protein